MKLSVVRQLVGSLGSLLYIPFSLFPALALEVTPPLPLAQCDQQPTWIETSAREWIERSRTLTQTGQPEQAVTVLVRALQLIQQLPDVRVKAELMGSITEEAPTGILEAFVNRAITAQQPEVVLSVLPLILDLARSFPTAYSSAKTQAIIAVARYYITFDRPDLAAEVLAEAQQAASFLQGAEFQTKALTAIAQGYEAIGNPQQTLMLLDQSLQFARQVQHPNPLRHAQILQPIAITYAQVGAFDQAIQVAQMIPVEESSTYYYNEAIAAIVKEYAEANQVDLALQLAQRLTQPEIKATTLAWLSAKLRADNFQQSQELLNQAVAVAQAEATPGSQSLALHQVILQYAQIGEVSVVLPVVDLISDTRTKAQALVDLAALETDENRANALVNQALNVAQQIEDTNLRGIIIYGLIEGYLTAKQYTLALQITQSLSEADPFADKYSVLWRIAMEAARAGEFTIALAAIESIPQNWADYRNQGFREVAVGYARDGQYDRAMQLVQQIDNSGSLPYQIRTLAAIAEQATLLGDGSRANDLLTQALSIATSLETTNQKSDAWTAIAIQYSRLGQLDRAAELRSQALETIRSSQDPFDQAYQLRQIVDQYLNAQYYEYAVQVAQVIPDEADRTRTLNEITAKLIEAQQLDAALQATNALSNPEDKARFLVDAVSQLIASGRLEDANQVLGQAFAAAQTIPGEESRHLQIREDLAVDDPYDRGSLIEAIALQYAAIGEYDRALQVAQVIQNPGDRDRLTQNLICSPN